MSAHTPGPWEVSDASIIAGEICIAIIETDGGYEADPATRKANASLIAAAPDMLEALENIENDDMHMPATAWRMIQNAIRKAKGGRA